jgi:hypothetical protein
MNTNAAGVEAPTAPRDFPLTAARAWQASLLSGGREAEMLAPMRPRIRAAFACRWTIWTRRRARTVFKTPARCSRRTVRVGKNEAGCW